MNIRMQGIVKKFGGIVANNHIDLEINAGEIHCLLGENGAGKSTLMHVLYGLFEPDAGHIYVDDQQVAFRSPKDAINKGIVMISQHFNLIPRMSVTENIVLGRIPRRHAVGWMWDARQARQSVLELMKTTGLEVHPDVAAVDLSVGEQQRVEILKSLYLGARILILDEPTAVLTPQEIDGLFKILRRMAAQGSGLIIITHKLDEALQCDRVTALRAGRVVFRSPIANLTRNDLRQAMFEGIADEAAICRTGGLEPEKKPLLLQVSCLQVPGATRASTLKGLSLDVHAGEIVGLVGVAGNGQTELFYSLMGLAPPLAGKIIFKEEDITRATPKHRRQLGISCISEDRKGSGLLLDLPLEDNIILGHEDCRPFSRGWLLNYPAITSYANRLIAEFEIKTLNSRTMPRHLSGGNQQKIILAREFGHEPDLIIAAQPTRGLDIKTTDFVRQWLANERCNGKSIILISYDLEEITLLADRIAVIFNGRIKFMPQNVSILEIGRNMAEGWQDDEQAAS